MKTFCYPSSGDLSFDCSGILASQCSNREKGFGCLECAHDLKRKRAAGSIGGSSYSWAAGCIGRTMKPWCYPKAEGCTDVLLDWCGGYFKGGEQCMKCVDKNAHRFALLQKGANASKTKKEQCHDEIDTFCATGKGGYKSHESKSEKAKWRKPMACEIAMQRECGDYNDHDACTSCVDTSIRDIHNHHHRKCWKARAHDFCVLKGIKPTAAGELIEKREGVR
jgi:hypothetical protein